MLPSVQRKGWSARLLGALTTPFDLDDYLWLLDPVRSTRDIRARVTRVERQTGDAVTLHLAPNGNWPGHRAGQHVQLGVEVDGVRYQRTFTVSSAPGEPGLAVTVKRNGDGRVSNHIVDCLAPGALVHLSAPAGEFVLPEPVPEKLLMIAGGSGITPLFSMLAWLYRKPYRGDIRLLCYNRSADDRILAGRLEELAADWPALTLEWLDTARDGRFSREQLEQRVPDFAARETFLCGPEGLKEAVGAVWREQGMAQRLHREHFGAPARRVSGAGGRVRFSGTDTEITDETGLSVLEMAESAGLSPKHGCRMGICHTCTCRLEKGRLRNLQNGEIFDAEGEPVRICIHAPEGDVELEYQEES